MAEFQLEDGNADRIKPVKILHHVDEIREGETLVERYNYVVYEFESKGAYLWARTYLDEIDKVAIFGPFADRSRTTMASAPDLEADAVDYLKRRFQRIDRLNPDKNASDAYETIWRQPTHD